MAALKQSRAPVSSIAVIVGHPLRAECWTLLAERVASPNELSRLVNDSLANVAYHVKVLLEAGVIELVDTTPRRGAVEHFYRAIERPNASDEETASRSAAERTEFARYIGQRAFADYAVALQAGSFGKRADHCTWRMPMLIDEAGWRRMNEIYTETTEKIMEVQAESAGRMGPDSDGEPIHVTALAAFFEMPERSTETRDETA
jgi:DNA-binding transcriptional ArsR family regulator